MTKIQEEIFEHLKAQGLVPSIDQDGDITFKYQMLTFAVIFSKGDDQFLRIVLPNIFESDDNNRVDVLEACNTVSSKIKVAKCIITPHNRVWIMTEQLLDQTPAYDDVIPRSLKILLDAYRLFDRTMEE